MSTMKEIMALTATQEYQRNFWNAMRLSPTAEDNIRNAMSGASGAFFMPPSADDEIRTVIHEESMIRPLAANLKKYGGSAVIWADDSEDCAAFVPEGAPIPGFDVEDDFTWFPIGSHKIAGLIRLSSEFAGDADFDLRKYISERIGGSFARTEDRAYVTGTGIDEPFGLLHDTEGAETGVATEVLSCDDCIDLYFSVEPRYRKHGAWLMNDRTAQYLHKLKDDDGNYLWNGNSDTILGRPVCVCNEMPDIASGTKPVLFGDFRYYWIVDRSPVCMKALKEPFALTGRVGYLGFELLDARLVRRDAVKAVAVAGESGDSE